MSKADRYLRLLCEKGAQKLGIDINTGEYQKRLDYELQVIEKGGIATYFLIVEDLVNQCRDKGIMVGPGRGSSAGSLVCFLIGITLVDPLKYDLLFERFLNPTRAEMGQLPDIDLDFQASRRDEVFQYLRDKYGEECVASIPTLYRFGVRSTLRDLARIESVPIPEVNLVTKKIPDDITLEFAMKIPEVAAFCYKYPRIGRLLPQMVGGVRHRGIHAAGAIITPGPVSDYLSLERVTQNMCTCFDKDILEEMGLLKFDILGLRTLDVINDTIMFVKEQQGIDVKLPVEFNDSKVYDFFDTGKLLGVFQFETQNLTDFAKRVDIESFRSLFDTTSIARPGTAHSGDADIYIKRKHGQKIKYADPLVEPILSQTYGVLVYQEQIMQICNQVAGFSLADAEKIRKLVSKSHGASELDKYKQQFIDGSKQNGVDEAIAEDLWSSIREAGAYSFNKSHAVAYSFNSYWCAWLKLYYPKEFLAALMRYEEDDALSQAVVELREHGYTVLTPDINKSMDKTIINNKGEVLFGLVDVENVGDKAYEDILAGRPYTSFDDFMDRRVAKTVNIRVVRHLIMAGAFDEFGRRDELYYSVTPDETPETWDKREKWIRQMEVLDMPPRVPVINFYQNPFDKYVTPTAINQIDWNDPSDEIIVRGVISSIKMKTGYGHMNLNDGSGIVNVLMSEEQTEKYKKVIERGSGTPVLVKAHMVSNKSRLYSDMIIPLEDYDDFDADIKYIKGEMFKELEDRRPYAKEQIGLVISSNYFTSKRGNKGTRIVLSDGERVMCFDKLSEPIMAGEIIEYKMSKDPFINILSPTSR